MKNEDKILDAALMVVKKNSISGTRMHLIAEEAGMLQSNIHYYYKTKKDLMLALQKKVLDKCLVIRKELRQEKIDTIEEELDVFIEQKREFILKYTEFDYAEIDFWVQGRIEETIRIGFAESFEGWRKEIRDMLEKYIPDISEEKKKYLPYEIVSILEGATIQYLIDETNFDLDQYFLFSKKQILTMIQGELV